ncbi:MAG: glutaredoxin 3 [Bdellovibrionales bacterium]|nr:glutaredoxin 3 [Bdellovibrionales bacterium]
MKRRGCYSMAEVKIYSKDYCPYCDRAKNLLKQKGQGYEEINLENDPEGFEKLKSQTGMRTVPQIFINGKLVGGFQELSALNASGELDRLLGS